MWPFPTRSAGPTPAEQLRAQEAAVRALRESTAALVAAANETQVLMFRIAELRGSVDRAAAELRAARLLLGRTER